LDVPRTHDLTQIFAAIPNRDSLAIEIDELANLTPYAVEMRYPGHWLMETREEATKAFEVATRIRNLLKPLLRP
jgi:HEPN domain-containing protein